MRLTIAFILLVCFVYTAVGQTGTYRFKATAGASGTIAVRQFNKQIRGDVFVWWHTASATNGSFSGKGLLQNNTCSLRSADDADCTVKLTFNKNELKAAFGNCMANNLPEDFSGVYKKITDNLPGEYRIAAGKAYFYKTAGTNVRLKTYLIKGNKVSVDIENITDNNWVFINFTNAAGKVTSGYLPWTALKL